MLQRAWLHGEGSADERVDAALAYARSLWRFRDKPGPARKALEAARALKAKPARPWLELAELETAAGRYSTACDAARTAFMGGAWLV